MYITAAGSVTIQAAIDSYTKHQVPLIGFRIDTEFGFWWPVVWFEGESLDLGDQSDWTIEQVVTR